MRHSQIWLAALLIPALLLSACDAGKPQASVKIEDVLTGVEPAAKSGDYLLVSYTGYLENGTVFDSSLEQGQPLAFVLGAGSVIKGWDEGLVGMKLGGRRKLTVPPELAYGSKGAFGGLIGPNATLIFEIDLLGVEPGVKITDLTVGHGDEAKMGSDVAVLYTGRLESGQPYDNVQDRSNPFRFTVGAGEVIAGWEVGMVGMQVGGKRRLVIPPYLAYGPSGGQGALAGIPPQSTVMVEVELLAVQNAK